MNEALGRRDQQSTSLGLADGVERIQQRCVAHAQVIDPGGVPTTIMRRGRVAGHGQSAPGPDRGELKRRGRTSLRHHPDAEEVQPLPEPVEVRGRGA